MKPLYDTKSADKTVTMELEGFTTQEQVANTFNSFFLNVGESLKSKILPFGCTEKATLAHDLEDINSDQGRTKDHQKSVFKFCKTNTLEL